MQKFCLVIIMQKNFEYLNFILEKETPNFIFISGGEVSYISIGEIFVFSL